MDVERDIGRRSLIIAATAVAGTAVVGSASSASAADRSGAELSSAPAATAVSVGPADQRYPELVVGNNQRFVAAPDSVRLATDSAQVVKVVQEAVATGKRLTVRSGGHCYADFVSAPDTKIILDLSGMNRVEYDPVRKAFAVEPGAQLGSVYEQLYRGHGVTIPGGVCPTVGIGGHATGGGFGLLSRRWGLVADYIDAVEVVVVGRDSVVRKVIATCDPADVNNDLWWATTGGGGGSFGVITKYWFRSPTAPASAPPESVLPQPPARVLISSVVFPWASMDRASLGTLIGNFSDWHIKHGSDPAYFGLSSVLFVRHVSAGGIGLLTQIDAAVPDAANVLSTFLATVTAGTPVTGPFPARPLAWLTSTKVLVAASPTLLFDPSQRSAVKTAYLRRALTDDQLDAVYANMTRTDYSNPNATLQLAGAGGQINALPSSARAYAHRDCALFALFENFWLKPTEDAAHLGWLRDLFGQTFAATGGYPIPNDLSDGCYINDPDSDITDPAYNTSGVPWPTLYWKDNYPRLQTVKSRWDPTNFFHHAQSIRLP